MVNYLPLVLILLTIVPILANRWLYGVQERLGLDSQQSKRLDKFIDFFDFVAVALIIWAVAVFFYNLIK